MTAEQPDEGAALRLRSRPARVGHQCKSWSWSPTHAALATTALLISSVACHTTSARDPTEATHTTTAAHGTDTPTEAEEGTSAASIDAPPAETPALSLVESGQRLYREGLLPDGSPVQTVIAGDIRVDGTQFTCVSCHQRSGMGSGEGWLIAPPIIPSVLSEPRAAGPHPRPAYTAASLEHVLRTGETPTGRLLEAPMPRVELSDEAADALLAYLDTLSAEVSPGVAPDEIHLATVVSADAEADTMLAVLQTFADEKGRNTRNETGRARSGPFYRANKDESYRKWVLHTWTLEGPPGTWNAQLTDALERQPVFALVGGRVDGPWDPVAAFCEENELPCLLPDSDLPPTQPSLYTVYASRGLRLEAAVAADVIAEGAPSTRVVTIVRTGSSAEPAVDALAAELAQRDLAPPTILRLDAAREDGLGDGPERAVEALAGSASPTTIVAWLEPRDLTRLGEALTADDSASRPELLVSSTLLDGDPLAFFGDAALPGALQQARILHPFRVPTDFASAWRRVEVWLRRNDIAVDSASERRQAAQAWFAAMLMGDALMHIKYDDYYRDYLLEGIDHMTVIAQFAAAHAGITFGPGQRFLSKGCYVLEVGDLGKRASELESRWRVP